jgi:hypothetical protein
MQAYLLIAIYSFVVFAVLIYYFNSFNQSYVRELRRSQQDIVFLIETAVKPKSVPSGLNRTLEKVSTAWIEHKLTMVDEKYHAFCSDFFYKRIPNSQASQDIYLFENYFSQLDEPGVYLDIGGNEPRYLSNTFFFEVCLKWKGVVIEPNPRYAASWREQRSATLIQNCVHTVDGFKASINFGEGAGAGLRAGGHDTVTCRSLQKILEENQHILGEKDSDGRYGSKINYISLDIEGYEPFLLGCVDIEGLFSREPKIQVWTIETSHFEKHGMNVVDASLLLAGYYKVSPILQSDNTFLDDVYIQQNEKHFYGIPQHKCRNGQATCRLIDRLIPVDGFTCPV